MEAKIIQILKKILGINNIDETCSQRNCEKWDSLRHLNLVVELESEFNIEFEPEEIAQMKSVEDIKKVLAGK